MCTNKCEPGTDTGGDPETGTRAGTRAWTRNRHQMFTHKWTIYVINITDNLIDLDF